MLVTEFECLSILGQNNPQKAKPPMLLVEYGIVVDVKPEQPIPIPMLAGAELGMDIDNR
jgi:hypothetical protein